MTMSLPKRLTGMTIFAIALLALSAEAADWDRYKYRQGRDALQQQRDTRRQVYEQIYRTPPRQQRQVPSQNSGSGMNQMMDLFKKQSPSGGSYQRPSQTYTPPPRPSTPPPYRPQREAPPSYGSRSAPPPSQTYPPPGGGGSRNEDEFSAF